jgi:CheY-like chemotaxis protein
LVTRVLSALGYQVTATATGPEALDMVDTGRPFDLLLTDLILPGEFQGHQVAELVSRSRPGLPILYMSGYTRDSIVHAGRLDEGVNFLAKPFTTEALAERVREVLEQGNLGRGGPGRGKSGRRGRGSERP